MSTIHGKQVANGYFLQVLRRKGRQVIGEEGDQFVVEREQSFADSKPHSSRGECLAHAVQDVWLLGFSSVQPFLVKHFPML